MLRKEENELLCRVGPGTPVGDLMRQYWLPAALGEELPEPDCRPLRVRLLGENLIAFRDSEGRVGLLADNCPHRGASLFFARNEEAGLRCVYHGWKFDVTGRCMDMPNEPPESNFKDKVKAIAYPCRERSGVVWAYMGPRATPPPLPQLEANMLLEGDWSVWAGLRECNWMQALEGDIDTSHLGFLHHGGIPADAATPGTFSYYELRNRAPKYAVVDTDYGAMYGAYREAEADSYYWRVAHFLFPFYTMPPVGLLGMKVVARAWVPVDDEHTMFIMMSPKLQSANASNAGKNNVPGVAIAPAQRVPNTSDWRGRFRLKANRANDYLFDPEIQRRENYTGIQGIHLQDQAITESMGRIFDRSGEHLGTSDAMIIRTRNRIINAARALREQGQTPPGVDQPEVFAVRAGGAILARDADWIEATRDLRAGFVEHDNLDISIVGNVPGT
jgi:phenylpropionate dioxygenase-like ring-hydroxylating dioxygenase large terminal subunit